MRIAIALTVLGMLAPDPVRAQSPGSPACGDLEGAESAMQLFTGYFTGDDPTGVRRALGIEALPGDYPRGVVEDPAVCAPLLGATLQLLGRTGGAAQKTPPDFDFAIYRFGPYYGILVDERQETAEGTHVLHRSPLYLFRVEGLEYVGGIMQ